MSNTPGEENRGRRLCRVGGVNGEGSDMKKTTGMVQRHNDHHHSAHQVNRRDAGFFNKESSVGHLAKLGKNGGQKSLQGSPPGRPTRVRDEVLSRPVSQ